MLTGSLLPEVKKEKRSRNSWPFKYTPLSKRPSQPAARVGSLDELDGTNSSVQRAKRGRDDASEDSPIRPFHASQKRRVQTHGTPHQEPSAPEGADHPDVYKGEEGQLEGDGDIEDENQVAGTVSAASGLENDPSSPDRRPDEDTVMGNGEDAVDPPSLRTALVEDASPEPDDVFIFLSQKLDISTSSPSRRDKERREISARAAEIAAKVEPDDQELLVSVA